LGKPKALQVEEDKVLAEDISLRDISDNVSYVERHRRGNWIPHKTIPIEGDLLKTQRERNRGG
jgi:hypothetical protein